MGDYGKFELEYVRTDRNGTKIYLDKNCPRCCGYGALPKWNMTGHICFACGGTGLRKKPKTVKVYTPEYSAKLEAQRSARALERLERNPPPGRERLKLAADEAERRRFESEGLAPDGDGYWYSENTFGSKDVFREAGGQWHPGLRGWVCSKSPKELGLDIVALNIHCWHISAEFLDDLYNGKCRIEDLKREQNEAAMSQYKCASKYVSGSK